LSGGGLHVRILGSDALARKFNAAAGKAQQAADAGAYNVGLVILRKAVRNAPKKWGVLRGSGHVTHPQGGSCTVGFGGPAAAYAWVQHERMDFKHTEGGPKYLERAVNEVRPRAGDIFLRIAKSVLLDGKPPPPFSGAPSDPFSGATKALGRQGKARAKKAKRAR